MAYFGNGDVREFLHWAGGFLGFRTGIPDGPGSFLTAHKQISLFSAINGVRKRHKTTNIFSNIKIYIP